MADPRGTTPSKNPPTDQNFLNFMQVFNKLCKFVCWHPAPGGLVPPSMGNLESIPEKSLLIGRTKILFAFVYKQSMSTSSGYYVTITVTVTVNKYINKGVCLQSYDKSCRSLNSHFYQASSLPFRSLPSEECSW